MKPASSAVPGRGRAWLDPGPLQHPRTARTEPQWRRFGAPFGIRARLLAKSSHPLWVANEVYLLFSLTAQCYFSNVISELRCSFLVVVGVVFCEPCTELNMRKKNAQVAAEQCTTSGARLHQFCAFLNAYLISRKATHKKLRSSVVTRTLTWCSKNSTPYEKHVKKSFAIFVVLQNNISFCRMGAVIANKKLQSPLKYAEPITENRMVRLHAV